MGYKENFKRRELEHELKLEDEDKRKTMIREEIRKEIIEQVKADALRERDGY